MQNLINAFLKCIKWPVALLCIFCFYPLSVALMRMIFKTFSMEIAIYFLAPVLAVMIIWGIIPGLSGSAFTIFAHESTHMLAALLTGHKPKNMTIHPDEGGSFTYQRKGNWLITIAPYFFPTFPFLWMLGGIWFEYHHQAFPLWYITTFGFLVGYHIVSNFYQIHSEQTDFKKAGYFFSMLFIPGANLWVIGYLWSFTLNGWKGFDIWQKTSFSECVQFLKYVISFIPKWIQTL